MLFNNNGHGWIITNSIAIFGALTVQLCKPQTILISIDCKFWHSFQIFEMWKWAVRKFNLATYRQKISIKIIQLCASLVNSMLNTFGHKYICTHKVLSSCFRPVGMFRRPSKVLREIKVEMLVGFYTNLRIVPVRILLACRLQPVFKNTRLPNYTVGDPKVDQPQMKKKSLSFLQEAPPPLLYRGDPWAVDRRKRWTYPQPTGGPHHRANCD
jgi:hypothetical protein